MILDPPQQPFPTDDAGEIIYPLDNGKRLSNDTEHLFWIIFLKNGIDDWFGDRTDVFVAADLLWYPIEGRPDICRRRMSWWSWIILRDIACATSNGRKTIVRRRLCLSSSQTATPQAK
jgi:hypothetical protein